MGCHTKRFVGQHLIEGRHVGLVELGENLGESLHCLPLPSHALTPGSKSPSRSEMIFKHISKQSWARGHIIKVSEYNTSIKCGSCLGPERMDKAEFRQHGDPKGKMVKSYSIFQCKEKNCHKTTNRDINGALNIWRGAFADLHGLERPETLRKRRQ